MSFVVRFFFAPLYFVGFISASVLIIQSNKNILWFTLLFITAVFVSFLAERLLPYEPKWNRPKKDRLCNLIHALVNEISNGLSVALIPFLAIIPIGFDVWPSHWSIWLQLLFSIIIADFGISMAHYLSHKVALLWRFHSVHHSVKRMYGFNGLMKHPLHQMFELLAGTAPLLLIGMPIEIGALLAFSVAIQLTLQHSNVDMKIGVFAYIWAVAPGHRHHHIASKINGDINFGLFTMIWDHLLGTFVINRPMPRDGEIGIEGQPKFPTDYVNQLFEPFKHRKN